MLLIFNEQHRGAFIRTGKTVVAYLPVTLQTEAGDSLRTADLQAESAKFSKSVMMRSL